LTPFCPQKPLAPVAQRAAEKVLVAPDIETRPMPIPKPAPRRSKSQSSDANDGASCRQQAAEEIAIDAVAATLRCQIANRCNTQMVQ